jgi:hypothetical protein
MSLNKRKVKEYKPERVLLCTLNEHPREILQAIHWGEMLIAFDGARRPIKIIVLNLNKELSKRSIAEYLKLNSFKNKVRKSQLLSEVFGIKKEDVTNNRLFPKSIKQENTDVKQTAFEKQLTPFEPKVEILMLASKGAGLNLDELNQRLFDLTNETECVDHIHRTSLKKRLDNIKKFLGRDINLVVKNEIDRKYRGENYHGFIDDENTDYYAILYNKFTINLCLVNINENSPEKIMLTSLLGRYARFNDAYANFHCEFEPGHESKYNGYHEAIKDYNFICDWGGIIYGMLPEFISQTQSEYMRKASSLEEVMPEDSNSNQIDKLILKNIKVEMCTKPDQSLSEVKPVFRLKVSSNEKKNTKVLFDEFINHKSAMYLYAWSSISAENPQHLECNRFLGNRKACAYSFLLTGDENYKELTKTFKGDSVDPHLNKINKTMYGKDGNGGLIGGKTESKDNNSFKQDLLKLGMSKELLNKLLRKKQSTCQSEATNAASTYAITEYKCEFI